MEIPIEIDYLGVPRFKETTIYVFICKYIYMFKRFHPNPPKKSLKVGDLVWKGGDLENPILKVSTFKVTRKNWSRWWWFQKNNIFNPSWGNDPI